MIIAFGAIIFVSCAFLYTSAPKEPAPLEDEGFVFMIGTADAYSTLDYVERYTEEMNGIVGDIPEVDNFFLFNGGFGGMGGSNSAMGGFVMKPWSERDRSTNQILQQALQPKLSDITGLNIFAMILPSLPTAGGDGGGEFLVGGVGSPSNRRTGRRDRGARARQQALHLPRQGPEDRQAAHRGADRPDKAAMLGIDMRTLSADMAAMLAGGYTNRFAMQKPLVSRDPAGAAQRPPNAQQLENYYTRTRNGDLIPLSTIVTLEESIYRRRSLPAARGGHHLRAAPGRDQGRGAGGAEQIAAERCRRATASTMPASRGSSSRRARPCWSPCCSR